MISREKKQQLFAQAQEQVREAPAVVVCEYWGLNVGSLTQLRRALREVDGAFVVVKNRVFKKAMEGLEALPFKDLMPYFQGPVGLMYLRGDIGAGCKILTEFLQKHESFKIKAGFYENSILSYADIEAISKLPSKEELMTKLLSCLVGVHRGVLGVLQGVPRDLVGVVNAIKDSKSDG